MDPSSDADRRAERIVRNADLAWVAEVLSARRDEILERWLDAAAAQPFHQSRRERAVADHIPALFDAVVRLIERAAPRWVDPEPPLDDPDVLRAAEAHAAARFEQGLQAADVVTEFRLLRQEIGRALHLHLADSAPATDVSGAELLVHDALDGAITVALSALTRQIEEARQEFLALTVHDVIQPITSIKGAVQLAGRQLNRTPPDLEAAAEAHRRALAATDQMLAVLTTLAEATRIALGQLRVQPTPTDMRTIAHAVLGRLDPETARRVRLDAPPEEDTSGEWDRAALERVLSNLLSNAIKFAPADTPIEVTLREESGSVHVAVRDHGIGMTADELARLFGRYGRARVGEADGQGLGLYLARGIVAAHGGRIWADSAGPGTGTTFHLVLPRRTAPLPDRVGA